MWESAEPGAALQAASQRRDRVIQAAVFSAQADGLRQAALLLRGLDSGLELATAPAGASQARDLLNRVIGWLKLQHPTLLDNAPHPEQTDPAAIVAYLQPLLTHLTGLIQVATPADLPAQPDQIEPFVERIAGQLNVAGLEEPLSAVSAKV